MNILVTGGAGYIGSHTCVELLQKGHAVVVADNLSNSSAQSLERVAAIAGTAPEFAECDVRDRAALDALFSRHAFDCVVHFAGMKSVSESAEKPLEYYDDNLASTVALCETMKAHGVDMLVFSSSATVYSRDGEPPLGETAQTGNCSNPYGWTKYMCERILTDVARSDPRFSVALLRYFNPVGAHPSGLIGESPRGTPTNLLPSITQVAVGKLDHLDIYGNDYPTPDGTGIRDYIHVCDLAAGHVAAIGHLFGNKGVHVFNLGTGTGHSVLEVVRTFEQVTGRTIPCQIKPRRLGDLACVYADISYAARTLGWKARFGLRDMCRDAWNWQSQNPSGFS
jgi:UDP-glucose 4-epimerase